MAEASGGGKPLIRPRVLPQRPSIYRRLWSRFIALLLAIYRFMARFISTLLTTDPGPSGNATDYRRPPRPPGGGNGSRYGASASFYAPPPACTCVSVMPIIDRLVLWTAILGVEGAFPTLKRDSLPSIDWPEISRRNDAGSSKRTSSITGQAARSAAAVNKRSRAVSGLQNLADRQSILLLA